MDAIGNKCGVVYYNVICMTHMIPMFVARSIPLTSTHTGICCSSPDYCTYMIPSLSLSIERERERERPHTTYSCASPPARQTGDGHQLKLTASISAASHSTSHTSIVEKIWKSRAYPVPVIPQFINKNLEAKSLARASYPHLINLDFNHLVWCLTHALYF
jgi:hypothetical protein